LVIAPRVSANRNSGALAKLIGHEDVRRLSSEIALEIALADVAAFAVVACIGMIGIC
jgi:hypothetical protein